MNGQSVSLQTETAYKTGAVGGNDRTSAVEFPAKQVGDVNLNHRRADRPDGVSQHNGRVGIGSWIQNDAIAALSFAQSVHQFLNFVRLEIG